jgi:predicted ChrR family anti-sigma factor
MDSDCNGLVLRDIGSIPERQAEFEWQRLGPGVEICELYHDAAGHTKIGLLRYAPGASVPEHVHAGMEYIHILSGSQCDERGEYRAGTLLVSGPGSRHSITSPEGCLVLAVWEKPVQFV